MPDIFLLIDVPDNIEALHWQGAGSIKGCSHNVKAAALTKTSEVDAYVCALSKECYPSLQHLSSLDNRQTSKIAVLACMTSAFMIELGCCFHMMPYQ